MHALISDLTKTPVYLGIRMHTVLHCAALAELLSNHPCTSELSMKLCQHTNRPLQSSLLQSCACHIGYASYNPFTC